MITLTKFLRLAKKKIYRLLWLFVGIILLLQIINIIQSSVIIHKTNKTIDIYNEDYQFYKDYYWKNNLTNIIRDSLMQYDVLLNAQGNVINDLTIKKKYYADSVQKPKMFNVWYEKVKK